MAVNHDCRQQFWSEEFNIEHHIQEGQHGISLDQWTRLVNDLRSCIDGQVYISAKMIFEETQTNAEDTQLEFYDRSGTDWIDTSILSSCEHARNEIQYATEVLKKRKVAFVGQHIIKATQKTGQYYKDRMHTQVLFLDLSTHTAFLFEPLKRSTKTIPIPDANSPLGKLATTPDLGIDNFLVMRGTQGTGTVVCLRQSILWLYNMACGSIPCKHLTENWMTPHQSIQKPSSVDLPIQGVMPQQGTAMSPSRPMQGTNKPPPNPCARPGTFQGGAMSPSRPMQGTNKPAQKPAQKTSQKGIKHTKEPTRKSERLANMMSSK